MEITRLGRTGLKVSRICLGTMNFGPQTEEPESHRIMDRALDAGINFFDTANVYGWGENKGKTETILGRWLAQGGARRERVVLATKVYAPMFEYPNGGRLSALAIRRACDESLRRLQTDRIDLYQMHHVDRDTPWEEIWQAMDVLVQQGKVLYVGSSNFAAWNVVQANETARQRHMLGLVSEQSLYNLAARTVELEVVPACMAYGVGILPWSPLQGGLLGGALKKAAEGRRAGERIQKLVDKHRPQLEAYEGLCAEMGEKPANVGVAWLLGRPGVTAPIVGPRTMEQLEDALHASAMKLGDDVTKKLDAIWPGPGGQAPEAYAW
ncbi:MAG TPA: aldo/keto reductase [Polyangiaceae bacterium]|jgi:aryl-alcohol dehydrogenase-like predicted oxidoreductase